MTTVLGATHHTGARITRLLLHAGEKAWPLSGSERKRAERTSAQRIQMIDRFLGYAFDPHTIRERYGTAGAAERTVRAIQPHIPGRRCVSA